jgi:hypothetical protein
MSSRKFPSLDVSSLKDIGSGMDGPLVVMSWMETVSKRLKAQGKKSTPFPKNLKNLNPKNTYKYNK